MRQLLALVLVVYGLVGLAGAASAPKGMVAADHPIAAEAGAKILRSGGNAVDAAIATALTLGVVQPAGSGLGGGGFAVVFQGGASWALDFREVAPAGASREMFLKEGTSSTRGGLAVAVPAEAFGLVELHKRAGKLDWAKLVLPALELASGGFERGAYLVGKLLEFPEMEALFGEGNRREGLARALRSLATSRGEIFRSGWVAEDMVAAVQGAGGVLTLEDLKNYQVVERMPLTGSYEAGGKHYTVVTMPSPSSGGTALLELLGATQGVLSLQCEVEAAKYAMARRALSAGDGSDAAVDPARIAAIRADCGPKTYVSEHYGVLVAPGNSGGTSHISVLDSSGMAIALTTTINTPFGSKLIAPKSGILLNDQMDDFTTKPGQPNAFGLIQSEANAIMPGKRPLSSMTPTLLLDEQGRVVMAVGGSGGPFIITATYQVIRNILDYGLSPQEAVSVPRWHHQWLPDQVMLEPDFLKRAELEAAGHAIREIKGFSTVQVVIASKGGYIGGADPRKGGSAVLAE